MPLHLFRSKRPSSSKSSNTIKKAGPTEKQLPVQRNLQPEHGEHIVDITNVGAWVKKNAADDGGHSWSATLKGKNPDRATIVSELDATPTPIQAQEAIREDLDAEDTLEVGAIDALEDGPQQRPIAQLILGRQDPSSSYFTQRHMFIPATALPSSIREPMSTKDVSILTLPDLDPYAFELYQIWLHGGTISSRCQIPYSSDAANSPTQTWSSSWPLFNAYILGCRLDVPNFADQVIDLLEVKLSRSRSPDSDTIKHLFAKGDEVPRVLQELAADKYIDTEISGLGDIDINTLPPAFLRLALQRAFIRLSETAPAPPATSCRYHVHAMPEQCYKLNVSTQELRRQQRLDLDRQKSSSDAQEVMRNFKNNDIKTVDWEERRAEALRATTLPGILIEDVHSPAQRNEGAAETAQTVPSRGGSTTSASPNTSTETTRLLHPSLTQNAGADLTLPSFQTSSSGQGGNNEPSAARSPFLPGTFPVSRNGSQKSLMSDHH